MMNGKRNEYAGSAEVYQDRLREIEIAFRYNLNLLVDRDAELDALEDRLRCSVAELERLSREKGETEEMLNRATTEVEILRSTLIAKDSTIRQLERQNEGNLKTLKKTVNDLRCEQQDENTKSKTERMKLERNFARIIQLKESKHSEEVGEMNRKCMEQAREITAERERANAFRLENRNLRRQCIRTKKSNEEKEQMYLNQIKQLKELYMRVSDELEGIVDAEMETKQTEVADVGIQTADVDDVDREKYRLLLQQNSVLKSIIKNLKRSSATTCKDCVAVKDEMNESNRRFRDQIEELKRALEAERSQRFQEEDIIKSLETSVVCLKEKLLMVLRCNGHDQTEGARFPCR